ncbi:hypothetical protein [Massilia sp. 9096]|uniref:hypothetical protein n=1 Tax=Massilia sp. 9096 TaxID=1500894 RepID=UPI000B059060|nr:hypothetical protein [Massilia sp. 9096]
MSNEQTSQDQQQGQQAQQESQAGSQQGSDTQSAQQQTPPDFDGLKDKKPEELTPEELRWMADTMPGEGPGD